MFTMNNLWFVFSLTETNIFTKSLQNSSLVILTTGSQLDLCPDFN